jgi:hypothetical protein
MVICKMVIQVLGYFLLRKMEVEVAVLIKCKRNMGRGLILDQVIIRQVMECIRKEMWGRGSSKLVNRKVQVCSNSHSYVPI